ncbi:MAG: hypothetical protein SNJ62_06180, partial [Chloracidobacterium sp.]
HQDLNRLLRAWAKPETIVVHEPWWTALARPHAAHLGMFLTMLRGMNLFRKLAQELKLDENQSGR